MHLNSIEFFDGRGLVNTRNNAIVQALDASSLYNVKPASIIIPFTSSDSGQQVAWDNSTSVTFTHSMNCYPIVQIFNASKEQLYPTVRINSGTSFTVIFDSANPIPSGQTWTCTVTYGAEYGVSGNINTDVGSALQTIQALVDSITGGGYNVIPSGDSSSSSSEQPSVSYVPTSEKGVASGVATLDANAKIPTAQIPQETVTVLDATMSTCNLYDSTSSLNNYHHTYFHFPMSVTTYVLPAVNDSSSGESPFYVPFHEILLEVYFASFERDTTLDTESAYGWTCDSTLHAYTNTATPVSGTTVAYMNPQLTLAYPCDTVALYDSTKNAFSFVASVSFEDASGNELTPLEEVEIGVGTVVDYLCRWSIALQKWVIIPIPMS